MNPEFATDQIEALRRLLPQVEKKLGQMGALSFATVHWTFLCAAAMRGPLTQARGASLSADESWRVTTEVLGFLTVLASRIASSFGPQVREDLMDDLVPRVVPDVVQLTWQRIPGAAPEAKQGEFQRTVINQTFENLYKASGDYAGCTSIEGGGGPEHWLEEETLVGVFGRATSHTLEVELDPMTRLMLSRIMLEPILFGPLDLNFIRSVRSVAAALRGIAHDRVETRAGQFFWLTSDTGCHCRQPSS